MKISAKARYGLRILLDVALFEKAEKPRTIREIAKTQGISDKFISRLVVPLREAGMIHSVRGVQGGFRLACAPADITLLRIVETLQGPVSVVDCVGMPHDCDRTHDCVAHSVWTDVNTAFRASLASFNLDNILQRFSAERLDELIYCI